MAKNSAILGLVVAFGMMITACEKKSEETKQVEIYLSSASGDRLKKVPSMAAQSETNVLIEIDTAIRYQTISGFGGAFTEASAALLLALDSQHRNSILEAYFGNHGARYSLCRTHINSCDFSLRPYSYLSEELDSSLRTFSLAEDEADIIPMIKMAQEISEDGFRLIASPWTAPPWMKDNGHWFGGRLKKEFYPSWAAYFIRYAQEMEQHGIPIWAFTLENEPLGNDAHWESMHFNPTEMTRFIQNHLAPQMEKAQLKTHILVYDQNRDEEMQHWVDSLLGNEQIRKLIYGTAVHWYSSTTDWMPEILQYTHEMAPDKHIIHTEGCIDADTPRWQNDDWYWREEATDWGWDWAPEEKKKDHPKYTPVFRYAADIIGCLNNHVEGWVDWNMLLDRQGGPNHVKNWCIAPVIVDTLSNEVYFTPLYDVMVHFSKFMRPGARRIETKGQGDALHTAVQNPDGSIVLCVLNRALSSEKGMVKVGARKIALDLPPKSLQTIVIH